MRETYCHSGKIGNGFVLVPAVGIVTAMILAVVYAYVTVYSPIGGYVNILFVGGFTFGLAMAMTAAGKWGKVRNPLYMSCVGVAVGFFALYCAWASFEAVLLSRSAELEDTPGYLELLIRPHAVWALAGLINETGWYSIKSATPTGMVLWGFWGIEAVIVVGGSFLGARASISDEVFCERCDRWCTNQAAELLFDLADEPTIQAIAGGDLETLVAQEAPVQGQPVYLETEVKSCGACSETATYQVSLVAHRLDKEGKPTVETSDLSAKYLLGREELARLSEIAGRPLRRPQSED